VVELSVFSVPQPRAQTPPGAVADLNCGSSSGLTASGADEAERRLRRATLPSRRVVLALFAAAVAVSGTIELSKAANAALEKKIRRQ
jgi:hypothetical protein